MVFSFGLSTPNVGVSGRRIGQPTCGSGPRHSPSKAVGPYKNLAKDGFPYSHLLAVAIGPHKVPPAEWRSKFVPQVAAALPS
jgi:hypothetical protein